jgi:hypothetical protein
MKEGHTETVRKKQINFIRIGGLAILLGMAIHIIANMALKTLPAEDFNFTELQEYLSNEKSTWAVVHGMRYAAIVCIIIFSAGLFVKTCLTRSSYASGWGIVGLLGAGLMMSNLMITNGIEILAFYDFDLLSKQEELFWLLYGLTRVLFTGEIVAWAILILGFSMAGWFSRTLPKWIVLLGLLSAFSCLLSAMFIVSILNEGNATIIIEIGSITGLLWFVCVGFYMLFQRDY